MAVPPHSVHLLIAAEYLFHGWQEGEGGMIIPGRGVTVSPLGLGVVLCTASAFEAFMNQLIYVFSEVGRAYDPTPYMDSEPLKKYVEFPARFGQTLEVSENLAIAIAVRNEVAHFMPYMGANMGDLRPGLERLQREGVVNTLEQTQAVMTPRWVGTEFIPWFCDVVELAAHEFLAALPDDPRKDWGQGLVRSFSFYRDRD